MKKKTLEGIDSLLFALGAGAGYILKTQDYSWWAVLLIIVLISVVVGKLVEFLRIKNKKFE